MEIGEANKKVSDQSTKTDLFCHRSRTWYNWLKQDSKLFSLTVSDPVSSIHNKYLEKTLKTTADYKIYENVSYETLQTSAQMFLFMNSCPNDYSDWINMLQHIVNKKVKFDTVDKLFK